MSTSTKGMIFVEASHPIIENFFREKLAADAKQEPCEIKVADFDDISYQILVTNDKKNIIQLSMHMNLLRELKSHGVDNAIRKKYGSYIKNQTPDSLTLEVDVTNPKSSDAEQLAVLMGNLKRNIMAAPFEDVFDALLAGTSGKLKPVVLSYRKKEQFVLQPLGDRVNVYLSIDFDEETDAAIADIILQEFPEAKRNIPNAPNVNFSRDMPADLRKITGIKPQSTEVGYLMFQVFETHVAGEGKDRVITLFLTLRAYLHYHIKASKAHLHTRMRERVKNLLTYLNRAHPQRDEAKPRRAYRVF